MHWADGRRFVFLFFISVLFQTKMSRLTLFLKSLPIAVIFFFALSTIGNAQVRYVEYFFDTDPGFHSGTGTTFYYHSNDTSILLSANISGLSNGIHRLFVRSYDSVHHEWSLTIPKMFFKMPAQSYAFQNITAAEYFIDTDPGRGLGTAITVVPGADVNLAFSPNISALSNGLHRLYVRSKDANGRWSITSTQLFFKEPLANHPSVNITAAEYFIDTDPGNGLGTAITVVPGADVNLAFSPNISSLSNGLHRLYVRSKDANGRWSITSTQLFFKEPLATHPSVNVTAAEYFFDTDPGFGHGSSIVVTPGADITIPFNPSVLTLGVNAFHRLFVRSRDANGRWSLTSSETFYLQAGPPPAPTRLTRIEYFLDTDPGFGNGTAVSFTRGIDVTVNFTASISALSNGLHVLYVRSQDSLGRWSLTNSQLFFRDASASRTAPNVTAAEYFFDTDPGVGLASPISVVAGADISFGLTPSISSLSNGIHRLFVRTRDADGHWSLTAPQFFFKEPSATHPLANIVAAEYFFDTDPGFGSGTAISVTAGQDITVPFTAAISSLSNGLHRLYVRSKDANGKWSLTTPQLFFKEPAATHPLANIVAAEYFFDTDPGVGSGTAVTITAGTDITIPLTAAIASLSTGIHRFYFRTRDANGKWSLTTPQFFFKDVVMSHTPGYLTRVEWFWDTDPGFGSGTAVTIPSSTVDLQNQSFTAAFPSSFVGSVHNFFIRSKDDWSLTTVVQVDLTNAAPLPVTLLRFSALREADRVKVLWNVAQERDMAEYVVERSTDGRKFDSIGTVAASGQQQYFLYDEHPVTGMNYYRLRQVEVSGRAEYSATVSVLFSAAKETMQVYPNPATDYFNISTKMSLASVTLHDLSGKLVRSYTDLSGQYSLNGIAAGTYIVYALGEDGQVLVKPLVVK